MSVVNFARLLKRKFFATMVYCLVKVDSRYLRRLNPSQRSRFKYIVDSRMPKIIRELEENENSLAHETWSKFSQRIKAEVLHKPNFGFFRAPVIMETMTGLSYKIPHKALIDNIERVFGTKSSELLNEDAVGEALLLRDCKYKTSMNRIVHCYQASRITEIVDLKENVKIIEWGGGYGGLCRVVRKINPVASYVMVDLPCSIALQYLYLNTIMPDGAVEIFDGKGIAEGKVTLVPSTRLNEIPKTYSADVFISSWALSESSREAQKVVSDLQFFGAKTGLLIHQHSSDGHPHADAAAEIFQNNFICTKASSFPYWEDQTILLGENDPSNSLEV